MIGAMAVILSSGLYGVRRRIHPFPRDAQGAPVPGGLGAVAGPLPGDARREDTGEYSIRLDPALWPLREDDAVTGPAGQVWIIEGLPQLRTNNADPALDYIEATGSIVPELIP
jgi:hypothetical protein